MAMGHQFDLDFTQKMPPAVRERIADGMKQANDNADPFWKRVIDDCIFAVARRLRELTADDVLDEIEAVNKVRQAKGLPLVETHNLAALGPAMKRACTDGILGRTDRVKRSTRPIKNGNRHNVWLSNFYEGK